MENQAQIQQFYKATAKNYIQYWVRYIQEHQLIYIDLEAEQNNIFLALQKAFDYNYQESFLYGVHAIYSFCESRGLYTTIKTYLEKAQHTTESMQDLNKIGTNLLYQGRIAMRQENYQDARANWDDAYELATRHALKPLLCDIEIELGAFEMECEHYIEATQHLLNALTLARQLQMSYQTCMILGNLGMQAYLQRELTQAETYCQEALAIAEQFNYMHFTTSLFIYLGAIAEARGDKRQSQIYWEQGLDLARPMGNLERISNLLTNLGTIATECKDFGKAESYLREGLTLTRKLGQSQETSHLLMDLGLLLAQQGQTLEAEQCMEESLQLARHTHYRPLVLYNLLKRGDYYLENAHWERASNDFLECLSLAQPTEKPDQEKIARILTPKN